MQKQPNSHHCVICGVRNEAGLHVVFYDTVSDYGRPEVLARFTARSIHQGYPGRLHGGMASGILDETIGRAIRMKDSNFWGVTIKFSTRYRQPVPLDEEIRVIGRIDHIANRYFEGSGEILLKDGRVAVEGTGKFIKLPLDDIADFDAEEQEWKVTTSANDPEYADL